MTARSLFAAALGLALTACGAVEQRAELADSIAASVRLARAPVAAERFNLMSYSRSSAPGEPITIYIEGDGKGWVGGRPPINPTPTDPLALRLAVQDPAANLAYLARPCQFVEMAREPRCDESLWTSRRFAPDVIEATTKAVDELKRRARATGVHLVGYSGGGAVAVLVAAKRSDVLSIRTVAGNLDHVALHEHHKVSQMPQSLNAVDVAESLARIPQIHYSGGRDVTVPAFVASRYAARSGAGSCVRLATVASASHGEGWIESWGRLARDIPRC